jgi:nitrite reductase/ring-hydroxylating ferredoxin subunit
MDRTMDFPDPIQAIGEQLDGEGAVAPPPEFFETYDVFAAELAHLFLRPWLAVDHVSRLAADGDYVRVDVGTRSAILVREAADRIHALRNACLHAGYRVCEAESGRADHLFCIYHGWSYALDGLLTDPPMQPQLTDRSRYRLPRYAMQNSRGLILIDMSNSAPEPPASTPPDLGMIPESLADAAVTGRQRHSTTLNWKYLRQLLWSSRDLVFDGEGCDGTADFGALSYVAWRGSEAALVRLIPRYPGQSDVEVVRMAPPDATPSAARGEGMAEALRRHGESVTAMPLAMLDRPFYHWYWSTLSAAH